MRELDAPRRGPDGAHAFWSEYVTALGGARTEFGTLTAGERSVGLFWTTGSDAVGAGREAFNYAGATLLEHDDSGKIVRFTAYFDTRELNTKRPPAQA